MGFFWTIVVLLVALALCWRYFGAYMVGVYEGRITFLSFIERPIYRLLGTAPDKEQTWKRYAGSLVVFSGLSLGLTYAILRLQGSLPLNPQHFGAVSPALSWNTAASFITNTNWQNYGGETTMSYLSQMASLTVQQFVTPAVGIAVALGIIRGFSRKGSATIGNFFVDTVRGLLYILLPIATLAGLVFVAQGAIDTLSGPVHIHDYLNSVRQTLAMGPVGFMESAGDQRRWVLQYQLSPSLREPDRADQLAVHRAPSLHSGCPDLRLRKDGRCRAPGRGHFGGHDDHFRVLGRLRGRR
jgi:K+-transporting ATPase ATPase A chain